MNGASGGVGRGGGVAATSDASLSGIMIPNQLGGCLARDALHSRNGSVVCGGGGGSA